MLFHRLLCGKSNKSLEIIPTYGIFELQLNNKQLKIKLLQKCNGFVEKEIVDPVTGKITIISNGCHGCGGALKEIILEPVGGGGDFDIRQEGLNVGKSLGSSKLLPVVIQAITPDAT